VEWLNSHDSNSATAEQYLAKQKEVEVRWNQVMRKVYSMLKRADIVRRRLRLRITVPSDPVSDQIYNSSEKIR
jgi:hypothetical protein